VEQRREPHRDDAGFLVPDRRVTVHFALRQIDHGND
jgi:hypothetical protein